MTATIITGIDFRMGKERNSQISRKRIVKTIAGITLTAALASTAFGISLPVKEYLAKRDYTSTPEMNPDQVCKAGRYDSDIIPTTADIGECKEFRMKDGRLVIPIKAKLVAGDYFPAATRYDND